MSKKISLALLFVFLVSLFSFDMGLAGFAVNDELKVIVASDLHFQSVADSGYAANNPDSDIYGHARYNGQMIYESEAILRSFLNKAAASDAEFILIPGDLVNMGVKSSHLALAPLLKSFETQTGKQIFVCVGNHDCSGNTTMQEFETIYNDFGFSQALSRDETTLSYTADLDDGYRLISISSASYADKSSEISDSTLQWIQVQCEAAKRDGKKMIAITHYNLLQHVGPIAGDLVDAATDARLENADNYIDLFADWGIKYVFTGHIHCNDISKAVSENNNEIYEIVTGALVGYPCTYRSVTFSDSGVVFKANCIDAIDTAYLPQGYTAAQIEKINSDFQGYAYGMVGASIQYMLNLFSSDPEKALALLTIDRNGTAANMIRKMLPSMYGVLCLPLYKADDTGGGSFEALLEASGGSLPRSGYKTYFDLVGYAVTSLMAGDENIPVQSDFFKLFWSCTKVALVSALDGYEEDFDAYMQSHSLPFKYDALKSFGTKLAYRESVASKLMSVLLSPLIEQMTVDAAPSDLNVTLSAYGEKATVKSLWQWFVDAFAFIKDFLVRFYKVIFS